MTAVMDQADLFGEAPPIPTRNAGSDRYFEYLAGLAYWLRVRDGSWSLWALAPIWKPWANVGDGPTEHVWLLHHGRLYRALVSVSDGRILRRNVCR